MLQRQGYDVEGVFMHLDSSLNNDVLGNLMTANICPQEEDYMMQ